MRTAVAAVLSACLLASLPASSAAPDTGVLRPNKTVTWSGGPLFGSATSRTNATCVQGLSCDDFDLNIQVPANAYAAPMRPIVELSLTADAPNDLQLIIIKPGADTTPGSTDYTKAGLRTYLNTPQSGTWTIRVACTVCAGASYTAKARAFGFAPPLPVVGSTFRSAFKLADADGATEPRITFDKNDTGWVVTNKGGTAVVYRSDNRGKTWGLVSGTMPSQTLPTIDVDVVATDTGRIIATELDFAGLNFPTSYSDDGGKTWTSSVGTQLVDMDRQWLATGPNNHVYLLYHNLFSGTATHNMWVMTSTDNGATFGAPIPVTVPGEESWLDLQCSDSGGPSSLAVNPKTGRLYVFWGARSSVAGGCAASPIEANIVAATRVWVATSPDNTPGSWQKSLAADFTNTGHIVGMQLSPGTLDRAGNVWVTYPESPHEYPNYDGAAIRVRWAPPDLSTWSKPITIAPAGGAGNVLTHIVAGDPGKIAVAYFHGLASEAVAPAWYLSIARSYDAMSATPHIQDETVAHVPSYTGTASQLMGACSGEGPLAGVENGYTCGRSTDVWGIALDNECMVHVTWPSVDNGAPFSKKGTYVSSQQSGAPLCGASASGRTKPVTRVLGGRKTLPNTGVEDGTAAAAVGVALLLAALGITRRLRLMA